RGEARGGRHGGTARLPRSRPGPLAGARPRRAGLVLALDARPRLAGPAPDAPAELGSPAGRRALAAEVRPAGGSRFLRAGGLDAGRGPLHRQDRGPREADRAVAAVA